MNEFIQFNDDRVFIDDYVCIERVFDVFLKVVWQFWINFEYFKVWYGFIGVCVFVVKMDVCVGGVCFVCMEMDMFNGLMQMWFVGEFFEVDELYCFVYIDFFVDEMG